jgi:hypothetical protein
MYKNKINIGGKSVPKSYVPTSLSSADKKKQIESIKKGTKRPQLKSFKSKRSSWVSQFEKKYNRKINDLKWISNNLYRRKGIAQTLRKGKAAYFSSGSRPNQNMFSWSYSRLASVLLGGPARKVDKKIWEKYKVKR